MWRGGWRGWWRGDVEGRVERRVERREVGRGDGARRRGQMEHAGGERVGRVRRVGIRIIGFGGWPPIAEQLRESQL